MDDFSATPSNLGFNSDNDRLFLKENICALFWTNSGHWAQVAELDISFKAAIAIHQSFHNFRVGV